MALDNILNGMDSLTGIFTVPASANYSFHFAGIVKCNGDDDQILLRVHQDDGPDTITKTIDLYDGNCGSWKSYYRVHYEWTMTLSQGNQIYLKFPQNELYESEFQGQLTGFAFGCILHSSCLSYLAK